MSDIEYEVMRELADENGISMSAYVRNKVLYTDHGRAIMSRIMLDEQDERTKEAGNG